MCAAPRGVFLNLRFPLGWKLRQKFSVVAQAHIGLLLYHFERIRESHLTVLVMVAIAFAIGSHMHYLGSLFRGEATHQAGGKVISAVQNPFEGNGAGTRAI